MKPFESLKTYLEGQVDAGDVPLELSATVLAIAAACQEINALVGRGRLAGELGATHGDNSDGDTQKELDLVANDIILNTLQDAPVAWIVSEELEQPARGNTDAPLVVAIDPLDGSSNIDTNTAIGTIFSILKIDSDPIASVEDKVLQAGNQQVAAGYVIYGPQTALVLTVGCGTLMFTLDPACEQFRLTDPNIRIPETTHEFAINVSNFRHWDRHIRAYVDDCLNGTDGFHNDNYNMRWLASLVAECHRILSRGGVFLYPSDDRKGYGAGRLRLLYEVSPIAFLIEQAGGAGTTGRERLLDVQPTHIHQRIPTIFGSRREIRRVEAYFDETGSHGDRSQLFNKRGLLRA